VNITQRLAEFAASLRYEDLPPDVVKMAKHLVLDTLGTTLAATTLGTGCREVVAVMSARGGKPEASIIGYSTKISAPDAAFANGALAHALNYDAYGTETGHIGVNCLTAPLAVAETIAPVQGARFLTAVVVAAEVTARTTAAAMRGERRASDRIQAGQYFGYFGAAAGAGHVLGMSAKAMHSAFGLVVMQVAGSRQTIIEGDAPAKAIYGAFPNQGGVLSALLADGGLEAEIDALGGKAGFYGLAANGNYLPEAILEGLGTEFLFLGTQFKPWPTSAEVAPFIEAAIELAKTHDLKPADIEAVEVRGPTRIRQWCEPVEERRSPSNAASAANSTLFATAKGLVHREVGLRDFTAEGMRDEAALAIAARTTPRLTDGFDRSVVSVRTKSGQELEATVRVSLGHPSRPLSYDHLVEKFKDCCANSVVAASLDVPALVRFVDRLEDAAEVSLLATPAARPRPAYNRT
jgi:2-methylcitrate dehydratase PrpD